MGQAPAVWDTSRPMAGLSEHARDQVEMHRSVAEMYRRRAGYAFADAFQEERNALFLALAPADEGALALDLGCGTGVMLDTLASRYRRIVGLDLSAEMLEGYDGSRLPPGRTVRLVRGDMTTLPFTTARFEAAIEAGTSTRYVSPDGIALDFACRTDARSVDVTGVEPAALADAS